MNIGSFPLGSSPIGGVLKYTTTDVTPPTLTSPTGTTTGASSATGTISTNEATGILYFLASTNATETTATVKASASQAVSAIGVQSVSFSGLLASTTYYAHYYHEDASLNGSTVSNSTTFTTSAASLSLTASLVPNTSIFYTHTLTGGVVSPSLRSYTISSKNHVFIPIIRNNIFNSESRASP